MSSLKERQVWGFIRTLTHELNECRLCLCSPPNVEWAIDRIANIEEALEKLQLYMREKESSDSPAVFL